MVRFFFILVLVFFDVLVWVFYFRSIFFWNVVLIFVKRDGEFYLAFGRSSEEGG